MVTYYCVIVWVWFNCLLGLDCCVVDWLWCCLFLFVCCLRLGLYLLCLFVVCCFIWLGDDGLCFTVSFDWLGLICLEIGLGCDFLAFVMSCVVVVVIVVFGCDEVMRSVGWLLDCVVACLLLMVMVVDLYVC